MHNEQFLVILVIKDKYEAVTDRTNDFYVGDQLATKSTLPFNTMVNHRLIKHGRGLAGRPMSLA